MEAAVPSSDDIRAALVARAEAYAEANKTSLSTIGLKAVNDTKFLIRVRDGLGFNINTYQRVVDWLDEQERAQESAA
ncbi:hypothetical protein HJB79_32035 [Rhizobium lentis]|uniref:hypothetical protein n=1 Tax=Rhizobium lentis TaxID=1138194 RepID=UPI001C837A9B|nr:hypothetical protein [Rhizobium lentis]MBX5143329.1 hypothetical protein [Rhizobium lentis]